MESFKNYKNETIRDIILFVFGESKLKEIESAKEFRNETIFGEDCRYTPYSENREKDIYSILDCKSIADWDTVAIINGERVIRIHINNNIYFHCDNKEFYMGEDV